MGQNEIKVVEVKVGKYGQTLESGCVFIDCEFNGMPLKESSFDSQLSLKEFYISGCCQKCQDKIFSPNLDDDLDDDFDDDFDYNFDTEGL